MKMRREEVGTSLIKGENDFLCRYCIIESGQDMYGIEIEKTEGNKVTEACRIGDVCRVKGQAYEIAKMLMRNTVTPITLHDILYDIVASDQFCLM